MDFVISAETFFLLRRLFADSATVSPSASKNTPNGKKKGRKRNTRKSFLSLEVPSISYSGHELITEALPVKHPFS
jgi:hypothetical protein